MSTALRIAVVIPALDEEQSIAQVVARVPRDVCQTIIVVDNGSSDATAGRATESGAVVVSQPRRGYGWACRSGCDAIPDSDIVVFMDGDGSMAPEDIPMLVSPIIQGTADVVCGARRLDKKTMPWHQRVGNRVIAWLIRVLYGVRLRELGPYRAVRTTTLEALDLPGSRFGWPAQLIARAARRGAHIVEIEVGYHARIGGQSKIGGSLRGSVAAAWDIIRMLFVERWR